MTREGALDPELTGRSSRLLAEPTPEDPAANRAQRRLSLARQLASIVPRAGSAKETRAAQPSSSTARPSTSRSTRPPARP